MKKTLMATSLFVISSMSAAFAGVDYSYCQKQFGTDGEGIPAEFKGYPFSISDDGKIVPHKSVSSYKYDEEKKQEILDYGEKPFKNKIVIQHNANGEISKVSYVQDFDAPEVEVGVGAKKMGFGSYGGVGVGMMGGYYPGGGFPGMGMGMGMAMQDSQMKMAVDIKIQNGKCFPYRSMSENKTGKVTERHFLTDVALCRDIDKFFKNNPKALGCFDKDLNSKMTKIFSGHKKRNEDVYKPDPKSETINPYGTFGGDFTPYEGGGFNTAGGGIGLGSYGMYLDNMVDSVSTFPGVGNSPVVTANMLSQYCNFPGSLITEMVKDEDLFKEVPVEKAGADSAKGTSR
ncbi:MAG: hypothetical protein WC635_01010 [Bacteriovorax sp.]|jgi:hypothetical protein